MKYDLYYGSKKVAEIEQADAEFPTFFGTYKLGGNVEHDHAAKKLREYIAYSVRTWPLIEANRADEIDYDEEMRHVEIIESRDWWLVDASGRKTAILVPVFGTDNHVNWRLDPER